MPTFFVKLALNKRATDCARMEFRLDKESGYSSVSPLSTTAVARSKWKA